VSSQRVDIAVIGAGPAGAATAIQAARSGANVIVFEKGVHGRDKVCGDGLTPRAVGALNELKIPLDDAHHIRGLRMIAGKQVRELDWPTTGRFPDHGAVWPRRRLDAALMDAAVDAGAEIVYETEATPVIDDDGRVTGVEANGRRIDADLTVIAAGAQGAVARKLGADRVPDEPFGLAIRTYAATPRHTDAHLEACLSLKDENGTPIPGYGWMFPAGDGTVNIGVGALSTMKGFKKLNLNTLLEAYRNLVQDDWDLGPNLERPRAWRLPMSTQRRHGPGWVAIGDAAGLVNPMNGEGIDYGLESGMLAADLFLDDPATSTRPLRRTGRRAVRRVPAHRAALLVPDRPSVDPQAGASAVGEHRRDRQHHPRRHGQPGRQHDARRRWPTRCWPSPTRPSDSPTRSSARPAPPPDVLRRLRRIPGEGSTPTLMFTSSRTDLHADDRSVSGRREKAEFERPDARGVALRIGRHSASARLRYRPEGPLPEPQMSAAAANPVARGVALRIGRQPVGPAPVRFSTTGGVRRVLLVTRAVGCHVTASRAGRVGRA
jgi:menaquinone-9 beta-reductase